MTVRETLTALSIASAIPVAAALWPGAVPWQVVLLAFTGWAGLFLVAIRSLRDPRRGRPSRTRRASDPGGLLDARCRRR